MIAEFCQAVGFDLQPRNHARSCEVRLFITLAYRLSEGMEARPPQMQMRAVARNCVKMCPRLGIQTLAGNLCIAENGHMETITDGDAMTR
jgi:hypothetical protein